MDLDQSELELTEDMGRFYDNPLEFVRYAYEWGKGELISSNGPFRWQKDHLTEWGKQIKLRKFNHTNPEPVKPIQMAVASGHGIGKSALTAWMVNFLMSTRPFCKGTLTANTATQLSSKTWAEVAKWTRRCITGHWFNVSTGKGSMKMQNKQYPDWSCTAQTCREENSEAFAGQHAENSTSFYIFDEASAVPDRIYEVAQGGLVRGEPMFFLFGNPTRNTGFFKECFGNGKRRHRWITQQIDSRNVEMTNKAQHAEWIKDYGEDSDFVRVRIKGQFPRTSARQFIPSDLVDAARGKKIHPSTYIHRPKILGVDIAREGDDQTVIICRQGLATYGLQKFRGLRTQAIAGAIAESIKKYNPDATFLDMGNIGASVYDLLQDWGYDVTGVWFGVEADRKDIYFNKRTEMYGKISNWLAEGGALVDDEDLCSDLIGPLKGFSSKEQITLERKVDMKKRGLASPDCGDALGLTFAYPVASKKDIMQRHNRRQKQVQIEYDPFAPVGRRQQQQYELRSIGYE